MSAPPGPIPGKRSGGLWIRVPIFALALLIAISLLPIMDCPSFTCGRWRSMPVWVGPPGGDPNCPDCKGGGRVSLFQRWAIERRYH
jgi:hypothetical protein